MNNVYTKLFLIIITFFITVQFNEVYGKDKPENKAKNIERLMPIREFKIDDKRIISIAQRFALKRFKSFFINDFYYKKPFLYTFISKSKKRNKHILIIFNNKHNKDEYCAISYILNNNKFEFKILSLSDLETYPLKKIYNELLYDLKGQFEDLNCN